MQLDEMIRGTLMQLQRDTDDLSVAEYSPALKQYINEGYALMMNTYRPRGPEPPKLTDGKHEPVLPAWAHYALMDYATYKTLLEGAPSRQARGDRFFRNFEAARVKLVDHCERRMLRNSG